MPDRRTPDALTVTTGAAVLVVTAGGDQPGFEFALRVEGADSVSVRLSPELAARVAAFLERRRPSWSAWTEAQIQARAARVKAEMERPTEPVTPLEVEGAERPDGSYSVRRPKPDGG